MHSSSSQDSCNDNQVSNNATNSTKNLAIIGLPLSTLHTSSILFLKSSSHTTTNHFQKIVNESTNNLIQNIHKSIDNCINFVHLFVSQNPLFTKLHSISSEYNKFCQINCRNQRNLKSLSNHDFAAIIPGDSVAGLVVSNGVLNFLNIYNTLLVVRLVLTWFPNSPPAITSPLSTLCDPYLNIFRGVIPPLGGTLDLSPILAFLVLNALTSTASALPAELPSTEASQKDSSSHAGSSFHTAISQFTSSQKKWIKRFETKRSKGSSIDD
uniref:ylmG homolog protein 2, chloroplastic n=1 Tax=Erigeron canadensis TaxID=72917 RepID=UPI001CB9B597|nr:ylmG homolog protein 2, chloroplastic [Erigeron canadensis]